jgi:hypothetical protein
MTCHVTDHLTFGLRKRKGLSTETQKIICAINHHTTDIQLGKGTDVVSDTETITLAEDGM